MGTARRDATGPPQGTCTVGPLEAARGIEGLRRSRRSPTPSNRGHLLARRVALSLARPAAR